MGEAAELADSLAALQVNLSQLSREVVRLREEFASDYRKIDNAASSLKKFKILLKECKSDVAAAKKDGIDVSDLDLLIGEIDEIVKDLKQRLVPVTGSLFVRLFLGRVNVKLYKDGERIRLKSEYEKFRSRTNPFIIFAACIQLFFSNRYILQGFFQTWLLYYYCTLALREHILKVNGSNINRWWIYHHYISILASMIMLTWHWQSDSYFLFYPFLMKFALFQGAVQVLMNRYQIGRLYNLVAREEATKLYNLVAREEATKMDVTTDIFADKKFAISVTVLLPYLIMVNCFQFYIGYTFLYYWHHTTVCEWQVLAIGGIFLVFACGNLRRILFLQSENTCK